MSNKIQVNWEDDDVGFEDELQKTENSDEFASLLSQAPVQEAVSIRVGDKITATVCVIPEQGDDILLECTGKESAVIAKTEYTNEGGQLTVKVGEEVQAFVIAKNNGEIVLSNTMTSAMNKQSALQTAFENQMPIKGKVSGVNKGGFEVAVQGKTAFCPVSQLEQGFVSDPQSYVGREYDFIITKFAGRNLVVSRTPIIEAQAKKRSAELEQAMQKNQAVEGKVIELKPFGAMVDLGGMIGMLHISEISYGRVEDINEVLSVGDKVQVKVLQIAGNRISLSSKAIEGDPWETVLDAYKVGASYTGKVTRLAKFGAFVELKPGVEGLIHLSEMSWTTRVHKASDVVQEGTQVEVRVLDINAQDKKMSLSMKSIQADPWANLTETLKPGSEITTQVESLKPFGAVAVIKEGVTGLVPMNVLRKEFGSSLKKKAAPPAELQVKVVSIDSDARKILLTLASQEMDSDDQKDFEEYLQSQKSRTRSATGSFGAILKDSLAKKS